MKAYIVFMGDLSVAPLQGQNPCGARIENFDDLVAARSCAEAEKGNWDLVWVYKRIKDGELEKIEQY